MFPAQSQAVSLAEGIANSYGLIVDAIVERRTVWGIVSARGNLIWKWAVNQDDEERLYGLARVAELACQWGLVCARPLRNQAGQFLTTPYIGAKPGYLQNWLGGRHVNVTNRLERLDAVRAIARLHWLGHSLLGFDSPCFYRGRLLSKLQMKCSTLQELWQDACKHEPSLLKIDAQIWGSITICLANYEQWLQRNNGEPYMTFCHRDLAPHNLLWQSHFAKSTPLQVSPVALIDFDHAGMDDPLHDVLQFISHMMFLTHLSCLDLQEVVDTYAQTAHLSGERYRLLWQLLKWPDILIRSVVEWGRHGYNPDKRQRILHAIDQEERRKFLVLNAVGQRTVD